MVEFFDIVLQKRRFVIVGLFVFIDLLLISLLAPTAQSHSASIAARIHAADSNPAPQVYNSPNVVTNALSLLAGDAGRAADGTEIKLLKGALVTTKGVANFDRTVGHGAREAVVLPIRGVSIGAIFTVHAIGSGLSFAGHTVASGFGFAGRGIGGGFRFAARGVGNVFGIFGGLTHVSSIIHPKDHTPAPTITELRIQQAALIQSGTRDVSLASFTSGIGGACDSGDGNGGYPMAWCNAPMDSTATVPYTNDPINRECTSYAFWYFTNIEGHYNFHVTGNAKYWANTSNYPTHAVPRGGAIAVETAGAYGHVAIVQALPGQKYVGQTVPAGYVLVSEMNYDWGGHFRYSFAPLDKFSAYIYR